MQLDLRHDAANAAEFLRRRVDSYAARAARSPKAPPVSAVIVGYAFEQRGWLYVHLDTRPVHTPDGEWTLHIPKVPVGFTHWHDAFSATAAGEPVTLLNSNGTLQQTVTPMPYDTAVRTFAWAFGITLRDVVLAAHRQGAFDQLPKRGPCPLTVHNFDGHWDWPITEPDEVYLARM